jgi:hypothetical protein
MSIFSVYNHIITARRRFVARPSIFSAILPGF